MIIKLPTSEKNFLFNEILQNDDVIKNLMANSLTINDIFKCQISYTLMNYILDKCYKYLLKFGFNENYQINMYGEFTQQLINIFSKQLTDFYKIELKNKNHLIQECIDLLGNDVIIIKNCNQIDILFNLLTNTIPFGFWGKVDWDKIEKKNQVDDTNNIISIIHRLIKDPNLDIIIYWDNADTPVIKTKLYHALRIIYYITKIGFYTWLFCPESKYVIEFTDTVRIGVVS